MMPDNPGHSACAQTPPENLAVPRVVAVRLGYPTRQAREPRKPRSVLCLLLDCLGVPDNDRDCSAEFLRVHRIVGSSATAWRQKLRGNKAGITNTRLSCRALSNACVQKIEGDEDTRKLVVDDEMRRNWSVTGTHANSKATGQFSLDDDEVPRQTRRPWKDSERDGYGTMGGPGLRGRGRSGKARRIGPRRAVAFPLVSTSAPLGRHFLSSCFINQQHSPEWTRYRPRSTRFRRRVLVRRLPTLSSPRVPAQHPQATTRPPLPPQTRV